MTLKLYREHRWHLDLNCQNDALKFNTKYETASWQLYPGQVFDTTVNSQFHILYWILKRQFDNLTFKLLKI
jgi:hypothetical protein